MRGRRGKQKKLETQLKPKNVFWPLLIIKVRVHRKPRGMTEIIQEAVKEREEERREGAGGGQVGSLRRGSGDRKQRGGGESK